MKLKQSIDSYDVKSLSGIEAGVDKMKQHCMILENYGEILKNCVRKAREEGFQDINCDRAEEVIEQFGRKVIDAEAEYEELSVSVKAFAEKIRMIWS